MTTARQAFQAFEKQWSAVRSSTREDRLKGTGLLTPVLLKRHIDSGEDLTLRYGRAGLTITYTPADLKEFEKAIKSAKGKHKAHLAGVPLMHLEAMSSVSDRSRVSDIRAATLYKTGGNLLYFQVTASGETANAPQHYQVRVRLEEWAEMLTENGPYLFRAKRACTGRISFDCGCGRHQYWYRYLAGVGNYAVTPPGEKDFPKIRNPKLTGACCKHVLKVLKVLRSASIHTIIAKELERQAGAVGFLDNSAKRYLKVADLQKAKRAKGTVKPDADMLAAYRDFQKAGKAFSKKMAGGEMRKRVHDLELELKVRIARERALRAGVRAEQNRATAKLAEDQHKALVQRVKDALQMAKVFGLDRDKALGKFAEASGVSPDTLKTIIEEEAL